MEKRYNGLMNEGGEGYNPHTNTDTADTRTQGHKDFDRLAAVTRKLVAFGSNPILAKKVEALKAERMQLIIKLELQDEYEYLFEEEEEDEE